MRVSCFLIILLVSVLLSIIAFCYLIAFVKFAMRKNRLNTVYTSDSIQQERLPVSLKVGTICF